MPTRWCLAWLSSEREADLLKRKMREDDLGERSVKPTRRMAD